MDAVKRQSCLLALALGLACSQAAQNSGFFLPTFGQMSDPRARVVVVRDERATILFQAVAAPIAAMVEKGLTNLTSLPSPAQAWASLVSPQETVGLKVYAGPASTPGTRLPVVEALIVSLLQSGHPTNKVILWDRTLGDLRAGGFQALGDKYGVRVAGAYDSGYDEAVFYENPLLGQLIFGDHEFGRPGEGLGRKSFLSKLVTREMDKIVIVSPLLNHNRAGVCGNLYTLAMASADNVIRFDADAARLAMAVPELCALPELGDRVVLNVVDALICQYQGQERELLHYSTVLNELRFSQDPVALDILSLQEIKRQREAAGIPTLLQNLELYRNASLLEIGISDPARIYVERVQ